MNVVSIFENIEAPNVSIVKTENKMHNIFSDGCDGVIWDREPLLPFQSWIDELEVNQLPVARTIVQPSMLRDVVKACCDNSKMPITLDRTRLIDDIAALGNIFSNIMNAPLIGLRLDCVTSNACRIFHVDAIKARLICTYRGTGTQYGNSLNGADPKQIFTVPTGSPMILRGSHWERQNNQGLLHRSPPIEGSGETRFVVVIDPIYEI
jgi:hypothetical protein